MSKMLKVVGASWLQTKISSYILGVLGILAILALFVGQIERIQEDGNYAATVFYSKKTGYSIEYWGQSNELADLQKGVARAYFRMDIDSTGWSLLEIETDSSYPDDVQAYAAGIVEGALTWYPIHTHLDNTIRAVCEEYEKQCDKLRDALERSVNVWKAYAAQHQHEDPFWHHVFLYYTQMSGVYTGWKHGVERSMNEYDTDISDLYWLNALADVKEIQHMLNITLEDTDLNYLPSLSSAFLRIVDQEIGGTSFNKLFVAHNAAGSYSSMTRVLKRYKLNYHQTADEYSPSAPGNSVEFSGYPGSITSQDEFYTVRGETHKLAVTGTTLNNYNTNLWKNVNITEQLPVGPRVTAANHLAKNVSSWGHTLASHNSGTACKQWLVADYAHLDKHHVSDHHENPSIMRKPSMNDIVTEISIGGKNKDIKHTVVHRANSNSLVKGLLWLIEQVPGRTHSADISDAFLDQRYWATYGLPFFKDIADLTHVTIMENSYGKIFSESDSPRALIFKNGFQNATSEDSIINLMRHNNLSSLHSENETNSIELDSIKSTDKKHLSALGVRGDMMDKFKKAFGVIDTKIASGVSNGTTVDFVAVSGPPYTVTKENTSNSVPMNKGNVVSIYNNQINDKSHINGLEIRDLIKQRLEAPEEDIPPFQWSKSEFKDESHEGLPDTWEFAPFAPKWSW